MIGEFIPDASVTLPWCFVDEATPYTDSLLDRVSSGAPVAVPAHWPVEILNGLLKAKLRARVDEAMIQRFLSNLKSFRIFVAIEDFQVIFDRVRPLAEQHRLTSYDAAYLDLAIKTGMPLATLDRDLQQAAIAKGIPVLA